MSQTRRSQKCALIRASTIAHLVGEPTLPRKRRAPARLEVGVGASGLFSQTNEDHLRMVYCEAINLIVSAIDQRFNQESFSSYAQMETFLVKAANGDDYEAEFQILEASYSKDVDSLRTADVSPRSSSQTFLLATRLSAAMSEEKRLPFAG